jgi:2-polyprenyl-3-methyl-5-hydroxy-6-metoxy-1,4-benzoquinol methylase
MPKNIIWTQEKVKAFWDYEAQFIENYFSFQFGDVLLKRILPLLGNPKKILDYGCGPGFLLGSLLENFPCASVAGLEISENSAVIAKQKFTNLKNFSGVFYDVNEVSLLKPFDSIFLLETIEHLPEKDFKLKINEISGLLKKNGLLVITCPNNEDLSKDQIHCPNCQIIFHRWQHLRSFSVGRLIEEMQHQGYSKIAAVEENLYLSRPSAINYLRKVLDNLGIIKINKPHLVAIFKKN